ncbi:MAG: phosphoadenosine phosphosulfate reductase family protein [Deinococcus sp.]|uniref:phosphoadenosine phosphosulfate reductase domain-containing protein n=1 Tax=Deinococcus sp. TaxID=47478 RepID=UPI0026DB70E2|nr:phosphoadenosine phosphosulfate reductase family protein [Deinococcus sp.]MDO4246160.1 phosphoadenosine phosphosulfate reductase family protein [Deinococcus sp.]
MSVISLDEISGNSFLPRQSEMETLEMSAFKCFDKAYSDGYRQWICMFSGGKDSTAVAITLCEWLKACKHKDIEIRFVYSDTQVEIPTILSQSTEFLEFLKGFGEVEIVKPEPSKSFWVSIIGKGYPAPHQKFRWCTDKLKIDPTKKIIRLNNRVDTTAIFTGVRFGESDLRDKKMYSACSRGGECGQGIWMDHSQAMGIGYYAPVAFWRQCDVWDYVNFSAYARGYPTDRLETIYNGRDSRFGCWTCTVVQQDKTMQKIVETQSGKKYEPLLELRNFLKIESFREDNRVIRPNGQKGRLKREFREEIFKKLLEAQRLVGYELISQEEIDLIYKIWASGKYGDSYENRMA